MKITLEYQGVKYGASFDDDTETDVVLDAFIQTIDWARAVGKLEIEEITG